MTNAEIAKVMGGKLWGEWGENLEYGPIINHDRTLVMEFDPQNNIVHAKLLQAKMNRDGWIVGIEVWPKSFRILAGKQPKLGYAPEGKIMPIIECWEEADTEPAALVALFEKIYGDK